MITPPVHEITKGMNATCLSQEDEEDATLPKHTRHEGTEPWVHDLPRTEGYGEQEYGELQDEEGGGDSATGRFVSYNARFI